MTIIQSASHQQILNQYCFTKIQTQFLKSKIFKNINIEKNCCLVDDIDLYAHGWIGIENLGKYYYLLTRYRVDEKKKSFTRDLICWSRYMTFIW